VGIVVHALASRALQFDHVVLRHILGRSLRQLP
jgi:hypothetical protein